MVRADFDDIKVKDQLGKPDDLGLFGPFRVSDTILVEEQPKAIIKYDMTQMAVWDDAGTVWDGSDLNDKWVDFENANVKSVHGVVNYNNIFVWNFTHEDTFDDDNMLTSHSPVDTSATTATVDIANRQVTFTAAQILVLKRCYYDSTGTFAVLKATLNVTSSGGTFTYEMSANGGTNWETITLGTQHTFANTGSDLRVRIAEQGEQFLTSAGETFLTSAGENFIVSDGAGTGTITKVTISYTLS